MSIFRSLSYKFAVLCFAFIAFDLSSGHAQDMNKAQIQSAANKLLISDQPVAQIKTILKPVKNIQVVVLDMPYREFPSIILFSKSKSTGKWERVFECLSPGIQDKPSGLPDWHTKGKGMDFLIGKGTVYTFRDKDIRSMVEASPQKHAILIPYQNFIHMQMTGSAHPNFAPYTIDKTQYFDLANILFDGKYNSYPKDGCSVYHSPAVKDCELTYANGTYTIKATTVNKQLWTYTFSGIDAQNRYLTNKKIAVKKGA